jgi:sulfopyruvate decarboxylase TPP-binding subunit
MLLLISYRGLADDIDFPEHSIMGEINNSFLKSLNLRFWDLDENDWQMSMKKALTIMDEHSSPVVLMVKKGVLCQ